MKHLGVSLLGSCLALAGMTAFAQADYPVFPVEMFGCNYQAGQSVGELAGPIESFNELADEQGIASLTSVTLTPHFFSDSLAFDVIGMDIWDSGAAMGDGVASLMSQGGVPEFEEVVDCAAHALFALIGIQPPPNGLENRGLFDFTDCTLKANRSADDGIAAVAAIGELMAPWNIGDAHGAMFPVSGETPDAQYTFKWVSYYPSIQAYGTLFDRYAAGAVLEAEAIIDPVMDCDISRMYSIQVEREATAEGG